LYRLADPELTEDAQVVAAVMADQRRAYAEAITDMIGLSKCRGRRPKGQRLLCCLGLEPVTHKSPLPG